MKINEKFGARQIAQLLSKVAITTSILLFVTCGSAQSTWQERTTGLEETRYLTKVAFGAGRFVGVGGITNGIVLISTNGHSWTPVSVSNTNLLKGVTFAGGIFVAVGENGSLITSADGLSWTNQNSGVSESLNAATYGNGLFVAVGNNGAIARSSNSISWTAGTSITNSHEGICFGKGMFVAVGSAVGSTNTCGEGVLISSSDGVSWTNQMIHTGALPREVTFANGQFVTTGGDIWSSIYNPGLGYICIGGFRTILVSSNGVEWPAVTNGPGTQRAICFGNDSFVSVGDNEIVASWDGLTWRRTYYSSPGPIFLSGVAFGNDKFIAVGGGKVMVSPADSLSSQATVPVSFSLQSYGFSQGAAIFSQDKTGFWSGGGGAGGGRGFNVAVVDLPSLAFAEATNFDTWVDRLTGGAHSNLVAYLEGIPNGKLVLIAVGDEAGLTQSGDFRCTKLPFAWADEVIGKLQSYGSTNIGNYCFNDSWGMIFIKGQTPPLAEGLGSGLAFPGSPLRLYTTFPRTVPRLVMSISTQIGGGGFVTYTLTVTNVVTSRDIEIQYSDGLAEPWQHLRTLNNPPTNVVQTSDFIMFSPARFFKAIMDGSVQLPSGF